jgi:glycosyltransferase involved in cell wall biosynthesis
MRPRILHVVPSLAPRYGGPSAATLGICRALAAAGTRTLIATTNADGPGRLPVSLGDVTTYEGLDTVFFPRQISESFKWSSPLAQWVRHHATAFDLVHVHAVFSHSSLAAGRACRALGVPYIVRPLGTLDPWSLGRHALRKHALLLLGAKRMLRGAAAIHYTARQEQDLAERRLPWLPRGIVSPLGVDDDLFDLSAPADRASAPLLVSMARLDAKKGIDLLIDAFHTLSSDSRLTPWRLVIAGTGAPGYVSSLERRARAGPARDRIEFRGWVSGAERHALLRSARLFALPSHQENFGIALVEAMACGLPAVVSPGVNLAAELELAGAGWIGDRERSALAETLAEAMASGADLDRRSAAARQFAERFRWVHVAERTQAMYDDVLHAPVSYVPRILSPARQA